MMSRGGQVAATEYDVRVALLDVLDESKDMDLNALRLWLAEQFTDAEPGRSGALLAARVQRVLAEFDRGDITGEELKGTLENLATWALAEPVAITFSDSSTSRVEPSLTTSS